MPLRCLGGRWPWRPSWGRNRARFFVGDGPSGVDYKQSRRRIEKFLEARPYGPAESAVPRAEVDGRGCCGIRWSLKAGGFWETGDGRWGREMGTRGARPSKFCTREDGARGGGRTRNFNFSRFRKPVANVHKHWRSCGYLVFSSWAILRSFARFYCSELFGKCAASGSEWCQTHITVARRVGVHPLSYPVMFVWFR